MQLYPLESPEVAADPFPYYESIRAKAPLVELADGLWAAGRHSTVDSLLRDRRLEQSYVIQVRKLYQERAEHEPAFRMLSQWLLFMNAPAHTRVRAVLMKAFGAKQMNEYQRIAQESADRLIDRFIARGRADLVHEYAFPLPVQVTCNILGVPERDGGLLARASQFFNVVEDVTKVTEAQIRTASAATNQFSEYFSGVIKARRRSPGRDLVSMMLAAEEGGLRLTEEQIIANIVLLFVAGHGTSAHVIGNSVVALHQHPEELEKLRKNQQLMSAAVTECLRFCPPIHRVFRTALEDIEIEGALLPQGQTVCLLLASANRDPSRYSDADRLIIDRPAPIPHSLAFSAGMHYCLGARLASVEIEVALATLFRRLPNMQIANMHSISWGHSKVFRGAESLLVRW